MLSFLLFFKKWFRVAGLLFLAFLFVFLSSIISVHEILPKLRENSFFSKFRIFQYDGKNVTIINNKEEVTIREEDRYPDVLLKSRSSFVRVVAVAQSPLAHDSRRVDQTGIIVTNDGLVIADASISLGSDALYSIMDSSGKLNNARLLGADSFLKIAYLKMDGNDYSAIPLANSDDVRVGKRVLSVASSATSKELTARAFLIHERAHYFNTTSGSPYASADSLEGVFLVDGLIHLGEEGSAVLNLNGEMIGILANNIIDDVVRWYIVPSNNIRDSISDASKLSSTNAYDPFGASYVSLNPLISTEYNLKTISGAWIFLPMTQQASAVVSGSAADKMGLKNGDIVVSVAGTAIDSEHAFSNLLHESRKNGNIELDVVRNGTQMKLRGSWDPKPIKPLTPSKK